MWELFFGVFGFHAVWVCLNPEFNTPFRVIFWQGEKTYMKEPLCPATWQNTAGPIHNRSERSDLLQDYLAI